MVWKGKACGSGKIVLRAEAERREREREHVQSMTNAKCGSELLRHEPALTAGCGQQVLDCQSNKVNCTVAE
jgi:hypothetical protein